VAPLVEYKLSVDVNHRRTETNRQTNEHTDKQADIFFLRLGSGLNRRLALCYMDWFFCLVTFKIFYILKYSLAYTLKI